jgi:pimeloyl-ACP methyl ester carboxylesterase
MNVVYLHGFASGPGSSKARFFERKFSEMGLSLTIPRLDEGDFEHLTITRQLDVIARAAGDGPVALIGSSLGGYLAALYGARHPEVERLVLMAPAFCFARRWLAILGAEETNRWRETGFRNFYHYGRARECALFHGLLEDGLHYEDFPGVTSPCLILHGTNDTVVPITLSVEFAQRDPGNVRLVPLSSGHELIDVTDRLWAEASNFLGLAGNAGVTPEPQV